MHSNKYYDSGNIDVLQQCLGACQIWAWVIWESFSEGHLADSEGGVHVCSGL